MLSENQRDEILVRLDERVGELQKDMKEAQHDPGFTRCQVHATEMDSIKGSLKWFRRTAVGGLIIFVGKSVWEYIINL
jgi:hypothetical protein